MVEKRYEWAGGAELEEHSRRKLKILREYFLDYLGVRCRLPQQERFRLAIVDGFAGGGRYVCGTLGSPLIFAEVLRDFSQFINTKRAAEGMALISIDCLLILNDESNEAIELLKQNMAPLEAEIKLTVPKLRLTVDYNHSPFESAYPQIKSKLLTSGYRNVLFNLDQCGHSDVQSKTLTDIMRSYDSAEIFYTFAIQSLIAFLRKSDPERLARQLSHVGLSSTDLDSLQGAMNRQAWLGVAERIVFESFRSSARFVSPFSINNPDGWRYWLIHFANSYRARQVYNNVLHENSSAQAHFGRSGLNMLSYSPSDEDGRLYLFDSPGREVARKQLYEDIPRLISEFGDVVAVREFYESIYNITPAHTDEVHGAIIDNPDIEVITPAGGERRKANTINVNDMMKLKRQKSFFPMFGGPKDDTE